MSYKKAPRTWIITDTHINHEALIRIGVRPRGHTEQLFAAMGQMIRPQDTLIHLGDVIFAQANDLTEWMNMIPCANRILVRGNHDNQSTPWYMARGFSMVVDAMTIRVHGCEVHFTHRPMDAGVLICHKLTNLQERSVEDGYKELRLVNIHGHLHGREKGHRYDEHPEWNSPHTPNPYLLIAHENMGYKPFELGKLLADHIKATN